MRGSTRVIPNPKRGPLGRSLVLRVRMRLAPFYWLFTGLCLSPVAVGQLPPKPESAGRETGARPKLFVPQRIHDLGTVLEGDKVTVTWPLENQGTADLVINKTTASCGCTVVQLTEPEKVIAPGASLAFKAVFDSTGRQEEQVKIITVHTNDPVEPELKLELRAKIDYLFEIDPPGLLSLRVIRRGAAAAKTVDIAPGAGRKSVSIRGVELPDDAPLTAQYEPFEARSGTGQRIRFTVSEAAALGTISTTAKVLLTIDGIDRERSIPIRGDVVGDLNWLPRILDATRQPSLPGKKLAPVNVSTTDKTPFEVLGAAAGPLFDVSVEPLKNTPARTEFAVHLTLRDDAPPGPFASILEVRTNSLDQPLVRVPVFGIVAAPIDIEPPMILLRDDGTPKGTRRRVKLQTSTQNKLEVSEWACDNTAVSVTVDREAIARYRHLRYLDVQLSGRLPEGTHNATLRVATTLAGSERLEIPVTIEVLPRKK